MNSFDLEDNILSVCLSTSGAIREAATLLPDSSAFSVEDNARVYDTLLGLMRDSRETDVITASHTLIKKFGSLTRAKIEWLPHLLSYRKANANTGGNLAYKCAILQQIALGRKLADGFAERVMLLQEPTTDTLQLLDSTRNWLDSMSNKLSELSDEPFSKSLLSAVKLAEQAGKSGNVITGIQTGISGIDNMLKGLQEATFTIMAARPSQGKTAEACQIAFNVAVGQNIPTAFFSLEMNKLQLARRVLAIDTGIKNNHLSSGLDSSGNLIDITKLFNSAGKLADTPLYVYDNVFSLPQFKARVNQAVNQFKVKLIIIDYIQLMESGTKMDYDVTARVTIVSRELKKIANLYNIPVLGLAQLNREIEKRKEKRPILSDLKDSGSLEQDADNIVFLFTPDEADEANAAEEQLLLNIVAKNRSGAVHRKNQAVKLRYIRATNQITDWMDLPQLPLSLTPTNQPALVDFTQSARTKQEEADLPF